MTTVVRSLRYACVRNNNATFIIVSIMLYLFSGNPNTGGAMSTQWMSIWCRRRMFHVSVVALVILGVTQVLNRLTPTNIAYETNKVNTNFEIKKVRVIISILSYNI